MQRFFAKVDSTGGEQACWLWTASMNCYGYGCFQVGTRKNVSAHRFAWALAHGPIPKGMCVLHRCDVPACVNQAHLFLGTQADNAADREAKGRSADNRGEKNPASKLTEAKVREIVSDASLEFCTFFAFDLRC